MRARHLFVGLLPLGSLCALVHAAFAQTWTQTSAPITNWQAVASSANGTKLVAAAGDRSFSGPIYTSTNSGATWTQTSAPITNWSSVASSSDGNRLAAVVSEGPLYTSTDSGATWDLSLTHGTNDLSYSTSVASSADGTRLLAGGYPVYTSTDSGATWTASGAPDGRSWSPVASSADGNTLLGLHFYGELLVSTNAGATWRTTNLNNGYWTSAALSADGRRIVAAYSRTFPLLFPGGVFTSTNSGATWTQTSAPDHPWSAVASSADGTKLVAAGQAIYSSTDSGATWVSNSAPVMNWRAIASSADGTKLVALANEGGIWSFQSTPAPLLSIDLSGSNAVLSWTVPSMEFVLQQSSDLSAMSWTDLSVAPSLDLTNLRHQVVIEPSVAHRFYRLKH